MSGFYGRCICCDAGRAMSEETPYCETCQASIRQVFDKDAFIIGQVKGNGNLLNELDWTNELEDKYPLY